MDTFNKKRKDVWSKRCVIHGVDLDAFTFVIRAVVVDWQGDTKCLQRWWTYCNENGKTIMLLKG